MNMSWVFRFVLCLVAAYPVSSAPTQHKARSVGIDIPDFVLKYAPVLYLHSKETHFPTDLTTFLSHTTPRINYTAVPNVPNPLILSNLELLSSDTYLASNDDIATDPEWLRGTAPNNDAMTSGINSAIIVNSKKDSSIDVFYFFFYAFNPGTSFLSLPFLNFGNHVGDWEHIMIRFPNPTSPPEAIWYSQHANGQAFRYSAVEKDADGVRPVAYVAKGSHANYAISGTHSHLIPNLNLPFGTLEDYTDKGRKWDPVKSSFFYNFNAGSGTFIAYNDGPVQWLNFRGKWGDEEYPESDKRQVSFFRFKKFVGGPTGPIDKQLNREKLCPENGIPCILRSVLVPRVVRGVEKVSYDQDTMNGEKERDA